MEKGLQVSGRETRGGSSHSRAGGPFSGSGAVAWARRADPLHPSVYQLLESRCIRHTDWPDWQNVSTRVAVFPVAVCVPVIVSSSARLELLTGCCHEGASKWGRLETVYCRWGEGVVRRHSESMAKKRVGVSHGLTGCGQDSVLCGCRTEALSS